MTIFDKIFVIGFPNSKRIRNFFDTFSGFNVELIESVDGCQIKGISELKQRREPGCRPETDQFYSRFELPNSIIVNSQHNMTPFEAACCLSHHKAHRNIINHNYKNTLILEEDTFPSAGLELLDKLDFDFDFDICFLNKDKKTPELKFVPTRDSSAYSYVVKNKESSLKYLNCFKNGLFCGDHPMLNPDFGLKVYCTTKPFFMHNNYSSIIDGTA